MKRRYVIVGFWKAREGERGTGAVQRGVKDVDWVRGVGNGRGWKDGSGLAHHARTL
jgi:hypothetical protein